MSEIVHIHKVVRVRKTIFGGITLVFNYKFIAYWHVLFHQSYTLLLDNLVTPNIQAVQLSKQVRLTYVSLQVCNNVLPLRFLEEGEQFPHRGLWSGLPLLQQGLSGVLPALVVPDLQVGEVHPLGEVRPVRGHGVGGVQVLAQPLPHPVVQRDGRDRVVVDTRRTRKATSCSWARGSFSEALIGGSYTDSILSDSRQTARRARTRPPSASLWRSELPSNRRRERAHFFR
uniref:Uncharacterized protein n=1 Tax=Astyanax mexicanus TaxID=7994 RepID=A0A8B9RNW6_ASTMX